MSRRLAIAMGLFVVILIVVNVVFLFMDD